MTTLRVRLAWALVVISVVGWPLSAFTLARDEPQFVLGLSWLAIFIESLTQATTAEVHRNQEREDP